MKTISRIIKSTSLTGISAVMAIVIALPAFAVENTTNTVKTETAVNVCTRIMALSTSSRSTLSQKRSDLQTDFSNRLTKLSTNQTDIDTKIADARTAVTTKFEDNIKSLEAKSGLTDVQKTAVETFKTNVEDAMTVRRAAVDSARSIYRTALASQISTHQQTLSNNVITYQTAVSTAFSTAVANCTDGSGSATMATLKATIKTARETLNASKTPDSSKTTIMALHETRSAAIKAANDTFTKTLSGLVTTVKTALSTAPTTDSTNK